MLIPAVVAAAAIVAPAGAQTAARHDVAIPAGSLDFALQLLAHQTGITVGGTDRRLATVRVPALNGRMTAAEALDRLLRGTPYRASATGPTSFRIARRPETPARPAPAAADSRPPPAAPPPVPIVVTASKRDAPYAGYPGGVTVFDLADALPSREMGGIEDILAATPVTASTSLGPGRNKIFIRGISDSSFNGPTQSTVGVYFGEQRLIYSAPNPELRLYDVAQVELLEGPQGTLYGTGALGGIVRIVPRRPELGAWSGRLWSGITLTEGGAPGYDIAGLVNAPIGDHAAARLLAYGGRLGGYIDDAGRGLADVNRTAISGGRADLRIEPGDGWTIDIEALRQTLDTRDGQYAEVGQPPLARQSAIAQPFDSDVTMGGITIARDWGGVRLVSATGLVENSLDTRFDASALSMTGDPLAYDEERRISLISHETRLSGSWGPRSSWVIGIGAVRDVDRRSQFLGDPRDPAPFADVRDTTGEIALFGESSVPLGPRLTATAGARFVYAESSSEQVTTAGAEIEPKVDVARLLPAAALSWRFDDSLIAYARYQRGYRTGGISIGGDPAIAPVVTRFEADELQSFEIGLRHVANDALPLEFAVTAFYTDWNDVQADRISETGFPFTSNIGSGWIAGLSASAAWHPADGLSLGGAVFANETRLTPYPETGLVESTKIPNIAELGGEANVSYDFPVSARAHVQTRAGIGYTGRSLLGIEPFLDVEQGGHATIDAAVAWREDGWSIALEGENLTNAEGNRFSFGNPFTVDDPRQTTPLRPRRLRLSATISF